MKKAYDEVAIFSHDPVVRAHAHYRTSQAQIPFFQAFPFLTFHDREFSFSFLCKWTRDWLFFFQLRFKHHCDFK